MGRLSVVMRPKGRSGSPKGPLEKTCSTSETDCADRMKGNRGGGGNRSLLGSPISHPTLSTLSTTENHVWGKRPKGQKPNVYSSVC